MPRVMKDVIRMNACMSVPPLLVGGFGNTGTVATGSPSSFSRLVAYATSIN